MILARKIGEGGREGRFSAPSASLANTATVYGVRVNFAVASLFIEMLDNVG